MIYGANGYTGELAARARLRGATVLTGRCIDLVGASLPYLPIAEALRPLRGTGAVSGLHELSVLLPGADAQPTASPSQLHLFEAVRTALERSSATAPVVLVLEDLHWADEATLDVLRLLTRRIEGLPALAVATYRDDGLTRLHPVQILLGDLATVAAVDRISLAPLSRDAVGELALGHDVDPDALYWTTGGNPFFVTQVLAVGSAEPPATVRDAVIARSAGLDRRALDLLEVVALVPPRAEPWLLEAVAGDGLDGIDDCLSSGLVTSDERGLAFRHELARLAMVDVIPPTRRRAIHRRVLTVLAARPARDVDHARLAHHAEEAGATDAVLAYSPEAARQAAAVGAGVAAALLG